MVANVVAMRSRSVGDYVYRVRQPSAALGRLPGTRVVTAHVLSPALRALGRVADVLVLHLLAEPDLLPLVEARRRAGLVTVYEISDNFLDLHEDVGVHGWFADAERREDALRLACACDAVQVTGPGLANRFSSVFPDAWVLENHMAVLGPPARASSGRICVGWAGSSGHRRDLAALAEALQPLLARYPHVDFAFMGDDQHFNEYFGALPEGRVRYAPPGGLEAYYAFLDTLHIGIATMLPTPYNECRSDVKFIEYASRGVAPVLSEVTPYRATARPELTALLFRSSEELYAQLERLVVDDGFRVALALRAQEYVRASRMESANAERRRGLYLSLLRGRGDRSVELKLEQDALDSEEYSIAESKAEQVIAESVARLGEVPFSTLRDRLLEAAIAEPRYEQPMIWAGRLAVATGAVAEARVLFEAALQRAPWSVSVRRRLLRVLMDAGATREALEFAEASLRSCPLDAPLLDRIAQLATGLGDQVLAERCEAAAGTVRRVYGPAVLGLLRNSVPRHAILDTPAPQAIFPSRS